MIDCTECDGTGQICSTCGHADGDCVCADGPELEPCSECDGAGEVAEDGDETVDDDPVLGGAGGPVTDDED